MSENRGNVETSFAVKQGCQFEEQHNVRCKGNSFSDCFQKRFAFRLWQILLFLFLVVAFMVLSGLLSPGVLEWKKTAVTNGTVTNSRKYNNKYNYVQHKASLNLCKEGIKITRLNFGS